MLIHKNRTKNRMVNINLPLYCPMPFNLLATQNSFTGHRPSDTLRWTKF